MRATNLPPPRGRTLWTKEVHDDKKEKGDADRRTSYYYVIPPCSRNFHTTTPKVSDATGKTENADAILINNTGNTLLESNKIDCGINKEMTSRMSAFLQSFESFALSQREQKDQREINRRRKFPQRKNVNTHVHARDHGCARVLNLNHAHVRRIARRIPRELAISILILRIYLLCWNSNKQLESQNNNNTAVAASCEYMEVSIDSENKEIEKECVNGNEIEMESPPLPLKANNKRKNPRIETTGNINKKKSNNSSNDSSD